MLTSVRPWVLSRTVASIVGLLCAGLSLPFPGQTLRAQTTVTFTNGQTNSTALVTTAPNDPTTLTIDTGGSATQSGTISGTGGIIKAGAGRLTLSEIGRAHV